MASFIPKFCQRNVNDAYQAFLNNKPTEIDYQSVKGEYLFLLDRSGSMGGPRIQNAKKALAIFLKSLPIDSYFNVVSFGSVYSFMFGESQKYEEEAVRVALFKISEMDADYGGT